jgi:heat shock protein HtpX
MRRGLVRVAMIGMGVASFVTYLAGASVTYLFLRALWASRPSALTSVLLLVGVTLGSGYLSYRFGTDRLLATLEATRLAPERAPELFRRLDRLGAEMGMARPRVFVSDLGEPNAFAMGGPKGGVVVLDLSLCTLLTGDELEGVLAHELAHLERHDGLVQLLAFTGLGTVVQILMLGLVPGLLLLAGIARADAWIRGRPAAWSDSFAWRLRGVVVSGVLLVPAVVTFLLLRRSRRREYAADARAAAVTGDPRALARALRKIDDARMEEVALRSLLPGDETESAPLARLLATHPATEDRIDRLQSHVGA